MLQKNALFSDFHAELSCRGIYPPFPLFAFSFYCYSYHGLPIFQCKLYLKKYNLIPDLSRDLDPLWAWNIFGPLHFVLPHFKAVPMLIFYKENISAKCLTLIRKERKTDKKTYRKLKERQLFQKRVKDGSKMKPIFVLNFRPKSKKGCTPVWLSE